MLKDIKQILFEEIKDEILEYEEISNEIEEISSRIQELESKKQEILDAFFNYNHPIRPSLIMKKFSFWDKWLFNRKEYKETERLNKEAQAKYEKEQKEYEEKEKKCNKEVDVLETEIYELGYKVEELKQKQNKDIRTKFEMIKNAKTLKELNLSFEDVKKILEDNKKQLVLDESDKGIIANESDFDKPEDFILVHKTKYSPTNDEVKSQKTAKVKRKNTVYFGEEFSYEYEAGRNTVHLCLNGEVSSHLYGNFNGRKYAVLVPFKNVRDDKNLVSFSPEDTFFEEKVDARGGYILCPKDEIEKVKQANPNTNVIGYEGESVDGFAASFISILGYKHEKINEHSWNSEEDVHKLYQFIEGTTDLKSHRHAGSDQYFRDEFLEYFNELIGFAKGVIESKKEGKNYDILTFSKALRTKGVKFSLESGEDKVEFENGVYCPGPSFTSLINWTCNPYTKQKLYLKDFIKDEDFKDDSDNVKDSNVNFLFYKLEKEFNIQIPQEVKELLCYIGNDNEIEEYIKLIQDEDTRKLLNEMKEEGNISEIDAAKDVIFVKTIIEQVYKENTLNKNVIEQKNALETKKGIEER